MDLLERDAQRAQLGTIFQQVREREGAVVLISGEAGVGKTAFVSDFTHSQQDHARIYSGACDPLFTPRPLGPVYDIAIRDLPPLLDLLTAGADWFRTAAALFKVLLESPVPVILVFEDIHWADEATLDLVKYLARRVQQTRTLLILTFRGDEIGSHPALRSVLGALPFQNTHRIQLDPLSPQAVEALARNRNRSARGLFETTRGNPFFVTEVLRSEGSTAAEAAFPAVRAIPATVRDAVLARVIDLPAAARDLLELASTMPGQAEWWLLETILHPDPSAVDACMAGGFLLQSGGGLVFRHELARLAIEESLPAGRRIDLNRRVLSALVERPQAGVPLARLVHHAAQALDADRVLEYGPQAAAQAGIQGAHREAVRYYQAALQYSRRLRPEEQARLLDALSFEYYLTGQIDQAIQMRQDAVALWRTAGRAISIGDDLRWLSRLYWFQGSKAAADRYAVEAVEALEALTPGRELAMAYSNRSQLYMLAEAHADAVAWGKRALELAERLGETEIIVHALTNIGTAELFNGNQDGREKLELALRLARSNEMHDHVARCYANLTSQTVQSRDYRLAEGYLNAGLAYTADRDMDSYSVYLLGWRARWHFEQGRWAAAQADAQEVLRLQPGSAVIALPGITTLGHLLARQGSPEAARWLDQARDLALPTGEFQRIGPVVAARAEAAWWSGHPERVLQELEPAQEFFDVVNDRYLVGAAVYWTWKAGGDLPGASSQIPPVHLAAISGDWQAAAALWARIGCPFEQALALSEGDAAAQQSALAIFEQLGAEPAARMLRKQMQSRGLKASRGARPATRSNPEGLTAREMQILALLEQGLSNEGIAGTLSISPKTVDHHVSAILAKLRVRSRLEAAAYARQNRITTFPSTPK